MTKKNRIRRPCVPDDFEEELTQEECDMIDKFYPMYGEIEVPEGTARLARAEVPEGTARLARAEVPEGTARLARAEADLDDLDSTKIKCSCGSMITPKGMKSHVKTKKHLAFVLEKNVIN